CAELTAERHDARGAFDVPAGHLPGPAPAHVDAIAEEALDDPWWDLRVRFRTGPMCPHLQASLLGQAAEMLGGDEALGRAVQAHEEHRGRRCHDRFSYFTNTHSGLSRGKAMSPMTAVAATSTGLLTFQRNSTTRLPSATRIVSQSPIAIRPRRTQAPRIVPMAAA